MFRQLVTCHALVISRYMRYIHCVGKDHCRVKYCFAAVNVYVMECT
jgi:hypothetical protein